LLKVAASAARNYWDEQTDWQATAKPLPRALLKGEPRYARLQPVVHPDESPLIGLRAGGLQSQVVRIGPASGGDEQVGPAHRLLVRRRQRTVASPPRKQPILPCVADGEISHAEVLVFVRPDMLRGKAAGSGQVRQSGSLYLKPAKARANVPDSNSISQTRVENERKEFP
jgi:hypothetical protein